MSMRWSKWLWGSCATVLTVASLGLATSKSPEPIQPASPSFTAPETAIVAPTKPVKRGHQVVLGVKPFAKPPGLVSYTYVWVVSPKVDDWFAWPDNSAASFGSGDVTDPSHYDVTLVANYLFADAEGKNPVIKTVETMASVDVGTSVSPVPTPTPVPPGPVVPNGRFGLAPFILNATRSLPAAECQKLAATLRGLSSKVAAGGITSKAQLVGETASSARAALGPSLPVWQPALDALAVKINALGITALPDCKAAYDEIATGLEAHP